MALLIPYRLTTRQIGLASKTSINQMRTMRKRAVYLGFSFEQ